MKLLIWKKSSGTPSGSYQSESTVLIERNSWGVVENAKGDKKKSNFLIQNGCQKEQYSYQEFLRKTSSFKITNLIIFLTSPIFLNFPSFHHPLLVRSSSPQRYHVVSRQLIVQRSTAAHHLRPAGDHQLLRLAVGPWRNNLSFKRVCRVHFCVWLAVQFGRRDSRTVSLLHLLS